jgi:hypothetical protein
MEIAGSEVPMENIQVTGIYVTNNSDKPVEVGNIENVENVINLKKIKKIQPHTVAFIPGCSENNFYLINGEFNCKARGFQDLLKNKGVAKSYYQNIIYPEEHSSVNCSGILKIDSYGYFLVIEGFKRLIRQQLIQDTKSYLVEEGIFDIRKERHKNIQDSKAKEKFKQADIPTLKDLCCSFVIAQKLKTKGLPIDLIDKINKIKKAEKCKKNNLVLEFLSSILDGFSMIFDPCI